ncbi:hypothetical protein KHQ81_03550 [Mycoplasmatota bacterium]|nr:hypothetical protein KHQ81_03550 [Mycoplasmatota bacterium]
MNNLNILNPKRLKGGVYNEIRIFDQLSVLEYLKCQLIEIYHEATFEGKLESNKLFISGISSFYKPVIALEVMILGSAYFYQDINTNQLIVKNEIKVRNGKLNANQIELKGVADIDFLDTAQLIVDGTIYSSGTIRSQTIDFKDSSNGKLN